MAHLGAVPCSGSTSGRVKKRGKGHRLPSQAKYVIMSVRKFFEKEREKQKSILHNQIVKRPVEWAQPQLYGSARNMKATRACCLVLKSDILLIVLDDFNVEAIHKEVHAFYGRKEYPTLDSLLGVLKDKNLFQGGRTTLWKVLREMGFRHKKYQNKQYIYEQPRVIQQHAKNTAKSLIF